MVSTIIFGLYINCKKNFFSIFNTLGDTKTLQLSNALQNSNFGIWFIYKIIKDRKKNRFAIDNLSKNNKPMINLGKSKVTAVLKL